MVDKFVDNIRELLFKLRLAWRLFLDGRVPMWAKIIPLLSLAYVVSPIDFIPDVILGLGQIDDLFIITFGLDLFEQMSPGHVVHEHRMALQRGEGREPDTSSQEPTNATP